jgi:hypothetical protein
LPNKYDSSTVVVLPSLVVAVGLGVGPVSVGGVGVGAFTVVGVMIGVRALTGFGTGVGAGALTGDDVDVGTLTGAVVGVGAGALTGVAVGSVVVTDATGASTLSEHSNAGPFAVVGIPSNVVGTITYKYNKGYMKLSLSKQLPNKNINKL